MRPYDALSHPSFDSSDWQQQQPVASVGSLKTLRPLASLRRYDRAIEQGRFRRARRLAEQAVHSAQLANDYEVLGRAYVTELGFPIQQRLAFARESGEVAPSLAVELEATAGRSAERLDTLLTLMRSVSSKEDYLPLVGAASELTIFLLAAHDGRPGHTLVPSRVDQDRNRVDHERNIRFGVDFIDTRHSDGTEIPIQVKTHASDMQYADNILVINANELTLGAHANLRDLQHSLLRTLTSDINIQARQPRDYTAEQRDAIFARDAVLIKHATDHFYEQLDAYPAAQSLPESA